MSVMLSTLVLASFMASALPYVVAGATLMTLAGVLYRTRGFFKANELQGQLESKDVVIQTNEQTIESFRQRVTALEQDFSRVVDNARQAEATVGRLQIQLGTLEKYAAPEAVERFEGLMGKLMTMTAETQAEITKQDAVVVEIRKSLDRIERTVGNLPH